MNINKWLIINWCLFGILAVVLAFVFDTYINDWRWWVMVLLIAFMNFTASQYGETRCKKYERVNK